MLRLRPYYPSDAQVILRWIHDETTFRRWSADRYDRYPIGPDDINRAYDAAFAAGAFFPMTAEDETGVVGHLILRYPGTDKNTVRFGFVIVDDRKRGMGYGGEMLSLALKYAFSMLRATRVTLGVFADNASAARCYRSLGFSEITLPEQKFYHVLGKDCPCLEMELSHAAYVARGQAPLSARPIRRRDRAVTELSEIQSILSQCKTCHVAMTDGGVPYVLPLSYGYELIDGTLTLWFHSAKAGRKLDVLRADNCVGFAISSEGESALSLENPCNSGYYYASVQGVGRVEFVTDAREKCRALTLLMERQAGAAVAFTEEQADTVAVFRIVSENFTGKRKPRPNTEKPD